MIVATTNQYNIQRRTKKRWKAVFFNSLDIAIYNSSIIYYHNNCKNLILCN